MTKDDIREFFEQYVESYMPFKDSNVFKALVKHLVEYYYDQLYDKNPEYFKVMFEEHEIPIEIYDNLLVSIGVPTPIIRQIPFSAKMILLRSFSDFQRYKSSIKFIQNLGPAFSDKVSVYELFIDYDTVAGDWVLKPIPIFQHPTMDLKEVNVTYDAVYREVPSLLVSKEQLIQLKSEDRLVLPIKSNLLLMDYNLSTDVSMLYNLIVATLIKNISEDLVHIYFSNRSFSISFKSTYFLWYWLITKYYQTEWSKINFDFLLNFHQDSANPYSLDDLDDLMDEYDTIETRDAYMEFYNNRLEPFFGTYYTNPNQYGHNEMESIFDSINTDLREYITDRIDTSLDSEKEIKAIVDEIYNSFMLYFTTNPDLQIKKYSEYFLTYLPQISSKIEETTTYIILYNLKPFHTEIITEVATGVYCDDKENALFLDGTKKHFLFELIASSVFEASDIRWFDFTLPVRSSYPMVDVMTFLFEYVKEHNYDIDDSAAFKTLHEIFDVMTFSDQFNLDYDIITYDRHPISTAKYIEHSFEKNDSLLSTEEKIYNCNMEEEDMINISDSFAVDCVPETPWPPYPPVGGILPL